MRISVVVDANNGFPYGYSHGELPLKIRQNSDHIRQGPEAETCPVHAGVILQEPNSEGRVALYSSSRVLVVILLYIFCP